MLDTLRDNILSVDSKLNFIKYIDQVLICLWPNILTKKQEKLIISDKISKIIEECVLARQNKNWKKTDELRDMLTEKDIGIKDLAENKHQLFSLKKNRLNIKSFS